MKLIGLFFAAALGTTAQPPCETPGPVPVFTIRHVEGNAELTDNPNADVWKQAASQEMYKDCNRAVEHRDLTTQIRAFWTDTSLYLLFRCPYHGLNLFLPPNHDVPRAGLWDRDVVETFIGYDWTDIHHYREFEIAPTGDWIDLAIDLNHHRFDSSWRSGWRTVAHIDEANKIWYAAAEIPLSSISPGPVHDGTKWRIDFYRIDGTGPDPQRNFLCWRPTCHHSNHVPERFGTLLFTN